MTNHTYAPMISCLDVQRQRYQADCSYKQIIHVADANSSKKLSTISGEDGLEITFQVSSCDKNGTTNRNSSKRGYRPYSRFKPDQGPMEARKSFKSVSRRRQYSTFANPRMRFLTMDGRNSNIGPTGGLAIGCDT